MAYSLEGVLRSHRKTVGHIDREFVLLVALGNLLAWPTARLVMNRWLQGFAYRARSGYGRLRYE